MKKLIAILSAITLMIAMTGCVSQADYDALTAQKDAEYNALLEEYNTLTQERDALQATVNTHADIISAIESENYEDAIDILSEKQIARDMAQKGDIDDYLVTVQLTPENFGDYFEFVPHFGSNAFGEEEEWSLNYVTVSKAYDAGLIVYKADFKLEVSSTSLFIWSGRSDISTYEQTFECNEGFLPVFGFGGTPGDSAYVLEECAATATRVEGTITFVKAEYVTDYTLGEVDYNYFPTQEGQISLVNGEVLYRTVFYGYKF